MLSIILKTKHNEKRPRPSPGYILSHLPNHFILNFKTGAAMKEIILYSVLIIGFGLYIWMLLDIWKFNKKAKSEWDQYWDNVFNNAKNNKQ